MDLAVIGAGPAGLMAAVTAAQQGASVTVFDQRRSAGRKFLLAGRSGLNLTNDEPHDRLRTRFEPCPPALARALDDFDTAAVRSWASELGVDTFVGSSGRVFPQGLGAAPLLRAWLGQLDELGVVRRGDHRFVGWSATGDLRFHRRGEPDSSIDVSADACVLALGGASWPHVSSDGSWARTLREADVEVTPLAPSNCGVRLAWSEPFRERFEGTPIKNVVTTLGDRSARGDVMITAGGLEGGPIYTVAGALRDDPAAAAITLDLAPDLDRDRLLERLSRRRKKDSQATWLRRAGLDRVAVGLLREATGNRLPDDLPAMATLIRQAVLAPVRSASIDRAISTAGGVHGDAIDDDGMLRARPGTFVAGEMIDWDAPTGGYLIHGCLASGRRAGAAAAAWAGRQPR